MGGRGASYKIKKHISQNDNRFDIEGLGFENDPETEYHNKIFKQLKNLQVSTRQSTDVIDDKILERQQKQLLNLNQKYKNILSETKNQDLQFGVEKIKGSCLGYCESTVKDGHIIQRIVLNKNELQNYDKIVETVDKGVNEGWFVPINKEFKSRDYLVTHEMGHAIENGLFDRIRQSLSDNTIFDYEKEATKIKDEVIKIWKKDFSTGAKDDNIYLSKYSKSNNREWFAETFTNLELAEEPAPIAKALEKYLKGLKDENL